MTKDVPAEAELKAKAMAKPQQVCHSTQQPKQQQQRHQHQQEGADVQNADGPLKQERPHLDSKAVAEASKVASTRPACESAVEDRVHAKLANKKDKKGPFTITINSRICFSPFFPLLLFKITVSPEF